MFIEVYISIQNTSIHGMQTANKYALSISLCIPTQAIKAKCCV